jgi:hypothetical protein
VEQSQREITAPEVERMMKLPGMILKAMAKMAWIEAAESA